METEYEKIGHRIRVLRHLRQVSQGGLAREMGLSQTQLSNIEHGKTKATLKNLFKIKELLGCSMSDFFEDPFLKGVPGTGEAVKTAEEIELAEAEE